MKKLITVMCLLFTITATQAQKKKRNAKLVVEVDGVCMMCKKRIEKAALNTKGVKYANWNVTSHQLMLIMDERKTSEKIVCQNLANVGHDTKEFKASEEAYASLHPCCKYRDTEIIENHHKKE